MDKSKTHRMMADCPQIQEHKVGDKYCPKHERFYEWNSELESFICARNPYSPWSEEFHDLSDGDYGVIYLPRQDQYWDMIWEHKLDLIGNTKDNRNLYRGLVLRELYHFDRENNYSSEETLLCAFYMKEAHSKRWDGEKWVGYLLLN